MNPQPPTIVTITEDLDLTQVGCSTPVDICSMWWGRMELVTIGLIGSAVVTLMVDVAGGGFEPHTECSEMTLTEALTHARVGYVDGLKYQICVITPATAGTLTTKLLLKKI